MQGFDSANSPCGLVNLQRTGVTGDSWIRQPKQPIGTQKLSTKRLAQVTHGFDSPTTLRDSKIINELLSRETHGFYSVNNP